MEFIIAAIVIIVLLLILGVSPFVIIGIVLALIELLLIFMTGFFVVALVLLLISRPVKAEFLRIIKHEIVGTYAVYQIDGEEYVNTFPAEIMFVNQIYHEGAVSTARLCRGKKKHLLFDWYSHLVIGVGLPVSVILAVLLGKFLLGLTGMF